jgi:hypothetical protein
LRTRQQSQGRSDAPQFRGGNVSGSRRVVLAHVVEEFPVRTISLIFAISVGLAPAGAALAQPVGTDRVPDQGVACPPDVKGGGPTVGSGSDAPLSDKLAQSKGVICPPAGVDRDIHVAPPGGGELKVIPPPGSPGGDPTVEPK